jgi:hypothetical protein
VKPIAPILLTTPQSGASERDRRDLAFGYLGGKQLPYVLVTGDQLDSRRDFKIVEDLNAARVIHTDISERKLSDVCL